MPLPPVNANVPNPVPVQPPVGGAGRGSAPGGVLHVAPEPQAEPPVQQAPTARSLAQKLDSVLIRAATMATRSADAKSVAAAATKAALPAGLAEELDAAAGRAATALNKVAKHTGREIAAALVLDKTGAFDWKDGSKVATAIREALDAQAELAVKLRELVNDPRVDRDAADAFGEAALQCDRRSSEIMTLAMQLTDAVQAAGDDATLNARLDKKLGSLLPRQALSMHGNPEVLAKLEAELKPLADRMDAFAAKPNASITSEEFAAFTIAVIEARGAVARAAKEGFPAPGGGRVLPDRTLLESMEKFVHFAEERLTDVRRNLGLASARHFADKTFAIPDDYVLLCEENIPGLKRFAPNLAKAAELRRQLHALAREYIGKADPQTASKMVALAAQMAKIRRNAIQTEIRTCRSANPDLEMTPETWAALEREFITPKGMSAMVSHFCQIVNRVNSKLAPEQFLSTSSARALVEGRMDFSTLVEARIHGMDDADVDPALDDSRMTSSETLGSGVSNTVSLVGYEDGSEWVFKPEAPGRQGMSHLSLSKDYKAWQQVAELNLATTDAANALGLGDVVPKCSVGSHKGQYGLFMAKAPGVPGRAFAKGKKAPETLSRSDIRKLPAEQYGLVVGRILRQANRLEWCDLLTGQGDRHDNNYLVEVKPDLTVTVTGIDNDQCFPGYRTGLSAYTLSPREAAYFESVKEKIVLSYPERLQETVRKNLDADPGVRKLDGGALEIDPAKFKSGELQWALRKVCGNQRARLPDFVDRELYDRLVSLKAGPARDTYVAGLRKRLPDDAVRAAVARLDEGIAHAEKLAAEGRVVEEAEFARRDVQNRLLRPERQAPDPVTRVGRNGYKLTGEIADTARRQGRSIFCETLLHAIERPGWFD